MSGSPHSTQRIGIALTDQVPIGRAISLLPTCPGVMVLAGDMPPVVAARTSPPLRSRPRPVGDTSAPAGARLATRPAAGLPLQGPLGHPAAASPPGPVSGGSRPRRPLAIAPGLRRGARHIPRARPRRPSPDRPSKPPPPWFQGCDGMQPMCREKGLTSGAPDASPSLIFHVGINECVFTADGRRSLKSVSFVTIAPILRVGPSLSQDERWIAPRRSTGKVPHWPST
jgi:hypothetical protein